jgi:hypothetical protein
VSDVPQCTIDTNIDAIISWSMDMPITGYDDEMRWLQDVCARSRITLLDESMLDDVPDCEGPEDDVIFSTCDSF